MRDGIPDRRKPGYLSHRIWAGIAIAALLALVVWTYRHIPGNGFHFDDRPNIVDHEPLHVTDLTRESLVKAGKEALLPRRPLPNITFAIDWYRGAGAPGPFLITNLVIHIAATFAIFGLLFIVARKYADGAVDLALLSAFAGSVCWAVHPIQLQAVTYIVQRMTSMAALFGIVGLLCYLQGRLGRRRWQLAWLVLSLCCLLLGSASKESAWIAPLAIVLAEFGVVRHGERLIRSRWDGLWLALPAALALFAIADATVDLGVWSGIQDGYQYRDFTMLERLMTQPRVILFHLSQILWPSPERFSILHEIPTSQSMWDPASTLWATLALLALCGIATGSLFIRKMRIVGFFLLWLPLTLVIESSIVPLQMIFEHRMYLPSVGLAGLMTVASCVLLRRDGKLVKLAAGVVFLVVVSFLSWSTATRSLVWRDDLTLWKDVVDRYPCSATGHNNLGETYWRGNEPELAMRHYQAAVDCDPTHPQAVLNLARSYRDQGRFGEALDLYRHAITVMPDYATAHYSLGMLYLDLGQLDQAAVAFRRVLVLDPEHGQARMFLDYVLRQRPRSR